MSDLVRAFCFILWAAMVIGAKIAVVVTIAIYYLAREITFGTLIPTASATGGFDPAFSADVPPEPTDKQMGRQMDRYEKTEYAKYLRAIEPKQYEEPF